MSENKIPQSDLGFVAALARADRQAVVESLLAGNDSGCFTTEMYRQAKHGQYKRVAPWATRAPEIVTVELCRTHLLSMPDLVREVAPDEWQFIGPMMEPSKERGPCFT